MSVTTTLPGLREHRRTRPYSIDWRFIEEALGVVLPDDYKEFNEFYPVIEVCEFFRIGGPYPGDEPAFLEWVASALEDLQDTYDAGLTAYRPHPAPEGGLLPWGESSSGDRYYWHVKKRQPVGVVAGSRNDVFWEFPGTLSEFLAGWLSGTIAPLGQPTIEQLGGARFLAL